MPTHSVATYVTDCSRRTAESASPRPQENSYELPIFQYSKLVYDKGDIRHFGYVARPFCKLSFTQDPNGKAGVASLASPGEVNGRWGLLKPKHEFKFSVEWDGDGDPVIRLDGLHTLWSELPASGIEMSCSKGSMKWEVTRRHADSDSTTPGESEMVLQTRVDPLLGVTRPVKDGRRGPLDIPAASRVVEWGDSARKILAKEMWVTRSYSQLTWEGASYSQSTRVEGSDRESMALVFAAWCARIWYYKYVHELDVARVGNLTVENGVSADVEGDGARKLGRKRNLMGRVMPRRLGAKKRGKENMELS
jgi:hypothetical protein